MGDRLQMRLVSLAGAIAIASIVGCGVPTAPAIQSFAAKSLSVQPLTTSYAIGDVVQLRATGVAADGSTKDLTGSVIWMSTAPAVATVSSGGAVTASGIGQAEIRAGYQTVSGSTLMVIDRGCTYRVFPAASFFRILDYGDGSVTTQPGCKWSVSSDSSWLSINGKVFSCPQSGACVNYDPSDVTGTAVVNFSVSAYDVPFGTDARTGKLMFRWNTPTLGQDVAVTQTSQCGAWLSPAAVSVGADGGSVHLFLLAQHDISGRDTWFVTTPDSWITLTSPPGGALRGGDGDVHFDVSPNPGSSPRVGTIVLCGFQSGATVTQAGR
jgi:hypothetical protein